MNALRRVAAGIALLLAFFIGGAAGDRSGVLAQTQGQSAAAQMDRGGYDDWSFGLDFRGWLTMLNGNVTVRGRKSKIDVGFDDALHLLDEVQFTMDNHVEVKKGPFGLILDTHYINLKDRTGFSFAIPILVPPIGPINIPVKASLEALSETLFVEGVLAYDIWKSLERRGGWPVWRLEALAGGRYYYLRTRIEADFTGPRGRTISRVVDGSRDWVDPIVGGRFSWRPFDRLQVALRSDFGGFTLGSQFAWNVEATVAYRLTDWLYLNQGYRSLYADYEQGSFEYDIWTHGPWGGITIRF